jgi:hypothetical protein
MFIFSPLIRIVNFVYMNCSKTCVVCKICMLDNLDLYVRYFVRLYLDFYVEIVCKIIYILYLIVCLEQKLRFFSPCNIYHQYVVHN